MVSRPARGRYLAKSLRNRGKNEVRPGACPHRFGNRFNHEPKSRRKLLVHAKEVEELRLKSEAKGLTLVPLKVYLKNGRIKLSLGVCRGKALHDKREALKAKAVRRELERVG